MNFINSETFIQKNYQKKKPFSSFLSGIAGKYGIPLWTFYVNRGQLISSFGKRDKNGSILEFFPANAAYMYTKTIGFRTFVKVDGNFYEFFKEENEQQTLFVNKDAIQIEEVNKELALKVTITYFTIPNEAFGALARLVRIENLATKPRTIEILDGITQILPAGIDYGTYKGVSNLLQSWMDVDFDECLMFYKLRGSIRDSAEVFKIKKGSFYISNVDNNNVYLVADKKLIFAEDTSLNTPYGFINNNFDILVKENQNVVNQIPCGYTLFKTNLNDTVEITTLIGHVEDKSECNEIRNKLSSSYIYKKYEENKQLIKRLTDNINIFTAYEVFDNYLKQCYLDNLLRGGEPYPVDNKMGTATYHLFSRKHGDLERDYNFFVIEPEFYSQGNGNFRDVIQNRRNDNLFHPFVKDHNLWHFISLITADGYNPLSIDGLQFEYKGQIPNLGIENILKNTFTPGILFKALYQLGYNLQTAENIMNKIIKESSVLINAKFGEGYWNDHFTYLYDLIDDYLSIYPENLEEMLFYRKVRFFDNHIYVKPRCEKTVLTNDGKVRQYGALKHNNGDSQWLMIKDEPIEVSIASKLITLVLSKYGILDPEGIGISYEADKPGWNDAMNGLPGLFGSGISEMFELKKLNDFLITTLSQYLDNTIVILRPLEDLINAYVSNKDEGFDRWNSRVSALETYRLALQGDLELSEIKIFKVLEVLRIIEIDLNYAEEKAKKLNPIYPTYLTYDVTEYEMLQKDGKTLIGEYGLPLVKAKAFKINLIPSFLEAPARYLNQTDNINEARRLYKEVKNSDLYDKKLCFYQTSVSLDYCSYEIGRIRVFTKGWLERESNFLHMSYKYLLGTLRAGLYDEFYDDLKTNLVCFMDADVYGRNPLENSSFIATSSNPDFNKHGQGFVSRLSGSTAEILSIYREMFIGKMFQIDNGELKITFSPKLHHSFFNNNQVRFKLFGQEVTYHNPHNLNTYDKRAFIEKITITDKTGDYTFFSDTIIGEMANKIRNGVVDKINIYITKGE